MTLSARCKMATQDVPVIVSNVRAYLRPGEIKTRQKTILFGGQGVQDVFATNKKVYVKWNTAFVCNPRSKKPHSCLVMHTEDIDGVLGVFPATYDTRKWSSKPFESWGYDSKLYFSDTDADQDILAIEQRDTFRILPVSSIESVQFDRTMPGTRSFDVVICDYNGEKHVVENIDKSELPRLNSEFSDFGVFEAMGDALSQASSSSSDDCSEWEEGCSSEDACDADVDSSAE